LTALLLVLSGLGAGLGCHLQSLMPEPERLEPLGGGARNYFAPRPAQETPLAGGDPLGRDLAAAIPQIARDRGHPPPVHDARLDAVAEVLAEAVDDDEVPGIEMVEFLLSHHGLGEPPPELTMLSMSVEDDFIRDRVTEALRRVLGEGPFGRVGVGVHRRLIGASVVVALQQVRLEMLPVPRRLPAGGQALLGGSLAPGLSSPAVLIAPPAGAVFPLAVRSGGLPPGGGDLPRPERPLGPRARVSFRATFSCGRRPGRYQIEVQGKDGLGKRLLANFPVFCGVDPPATGPRVGITRPETRDAAAAERLLLETVNQDRRAAALPPLSWDPTLAKVARAYAEEMAQSRVVAHASPRSGNARSRLRAESDAPALVLENVARAYSVADAHKSFLGSPGHRANVFHPQVQRAGVGVAIRDEPGGVASLYVTQLFAR